MHEQLKLPATKIESGEFNISKNGLIAILNKMEPEDKAQFIVILVEMLASDVGGYEILSEKIGMSSTHVIDMFSTDLFKKTFLDMEKEVKGLRTVLSMVSNSLKQQQALNVKNLSSLSSFMEIGYRVCFMNRQGTDESFRSAINELEKLISENQNNTFNSSFEG